MDAITYRATFAKRMAEFERFRKWELENDRDLSPDETLKCLSELYELFPPNNQATEIDPTGVARMHQILAHMPKE